MAAVDNYPIVSCETQKDWRDWLEQNYDSVKGIWLRLNKKNSGITLIFYDEALDEALCYGWIDGQLKSLDEKAYLQKFTPRRTKSPWSKRNIDHIARLTKEGRMRPSGLREAEAAKADGRWDKAYDPGSSMTMPEDFLKELSKDKKSLDFFNTLNKSNTYAIAWRLQTAKKPETREKRMKEILDMMAKGIRLH
jgi:uncharacterized protein YdeI (YjbR/CyaY-like superfamily)